MSEDCIYDAMSRHGLVINWNKSNAMVFSKVYMECKVEVEGVCLEQVRETL